MRQASSPASPPPLQHNELLSLPNIINHLHFYSEPQCFIQLQGTIHHGPSQHCSRANDRHFGNKDTSQLAACYTYASPPPHVPLILYKTRGRARPLGSAGL